MTTDNSTTNDMRTPTEADVGKCNSDRTHNITLFDPTTDRPSIPAVFATPIVEFEASSESDSTFSFGYNFIGEGDVSEYPDTTPRVGVSEPNDERVVVTVASEGEQSRHVFHITDPDFRTVRYAESGTPPRDVVAAVNATGYAYEDPEVAEALDTIAATEAVFRRLFAAVDVLEGSEKRVFRNIAEQFVGTAVFFHRTATLEAVDPAAARDVQRLAYPNINTGIYKQAATIGATRSVKRHPAASTLLTTNEPCDDPLVENFKLVSCIAVESFTVSDEKYCRIRLVTPLGERHNVFRVIGDDFQFERSRDARSRPNIAVVDAVEAADYSFNNIGLADVSVSPLSEPKLNAARRITAVVQLVTTEIVPGVGGEPIADITSIEQVSDRDPTLIGYIGPSVLLASFAYLVLATVFDDAQADSFTQMLDDLCKSDSEARELIKQVKETAETAAARLNEKQMSVFAHLADEAEAGYWAAASVDFLNLYGHKFENTR